MVKALKQIQTAGEGVTATGNPHSIMIRMNEKKDVNDNYDDDDDFFLSFFQTK